MEVRSLGDLDVPAIGFGAMVLSPGFYGPIDDEEARHGLAAAIEAGSTFIDTADAYGQDAHNERLIGDVIAGRRDDVTIGTKFGLRIPAGAPRHTFELAHSTMAVNAEPRHVRRYAQASLDRLGTDHIDVYSPHFPDPMVPIEETVGAVAELVSDGLVRHIGLSNVTADQLTRAVAVHRISVVQCEWSMWTPIDPTLLAVADAHDVGIVAWSPLGAGMLTGGLPALDESDFRRRFPRFAGANLSVNNDRFAPVRSLAGDLGITAAQLALAWLLHQHAAVVPIPGSRHPGHIAENADAARISLSADDIARIDAALVDAQPQGGTIMDVASGGRR
jgi:aryl-alcohol dehydrogenase-like predicted oxidoreductase